MRTGVTPCPMSRMRAASGVGARSVPWQDLPSPARPV